MSTSLTAMNLVAPALAGGVFIIAMSCVAEPARQRFNAILVAGAGAAYLNGGLGALELAYIPFATLVAYRGLTSYPFIGIAWLMHTGWDVVHHLYANPIWVWQPASSAGCAVFDAVIAVWFLFGAPSVLSRWRAPRSVQGVGD